MGRRVGMGRSGCKGAGVGARAVSTRGREGSPLLGMGGSAKNSLVYFA